MTEAGDTSSIFEAEVRRIARQLFPKAQNNNPVILDGRERDGVFNDGEVFHIIEATISTRKDKAERDLLKSAELVKKLRQEYQDFNFKIWFITQNDPTADQNSLLPEIRRKAKCPVEICSYKFFSSKLINAPQYIQCRENHIFGSIRDFFEEDELFNKERKPEDIYIPIDLINYKDKSLFSIKDFPEHLLKNPKTYLLVGDFGTGKSMTMYHTYSNLVKLYMTGKATTFPVYLNLREHFGQTDPSEALIRHANKIGFSSPLDLVAAWKAGYCHIFLDGFDELSSSRFARGVIGLKQVRKDAMSLVYEFSKNHPSGTSIFISGRQNYFDSMNELESALGLSKNFVCLTLNEFSQEQVEAFLKKVETLLNKKGSDQKVPSWLPSRPLLVGYLATNRLLYNQETDINSLSREKGWDYLIDRICEREARQIDPISIEPKSFREFIERLATFTRQTNSGRGPIHLNDIHKIFQDVFAMPPDEKASTLILRMPGLISVSGQEDTREFIDDDYVDACRSGDVVRFVGAMHDQRYGILRDATVNMGELGCSLAAYKLLEQTPKKLSAALQLSAENEAPCLSFDILRIMQHIGNKYTGDRITISGGFFSDYQATKTPNFSEIVFSECYFSVVEIDEGANSGPQFVQCQIDKIRGCISSDDIPEFLRNSIDGIVEYEDEAQTNSDILNLQISTSIKVLMTILRKLFLQPGRGRRENAFFRGLDSRSKVYVSEILSIIEQMNFAKPHKINGPVVWFYNRSLASEARAIIQSPQQSTHQLVEKVRAL